METVLPVMRTFQACFNAPKGTSVVKLPSGSGVGRMGQGKWNSTLVPGGKDIETLHTELLTGLVDSSLPTSAQLHVSEGAVVVAAPLRRRRWIFLIVVVGGFVVVLTLVVVVCGFVVVRSLVVVVASAPLT